MKKIVILPYFGKFNSYFELWLRSCEKNIGIDWLIITDNNINRNLPSNIKIVKKTFEELKSEFQSKFDFKICLNRPYKLCDYKQFYGYLFEKYLDGYDFWGYCDCDVVFGDISKFLPDSLFEKYDKLLRTGHLSFVRNSKEINELFKKYDTYKIVLTSPAIYGYDESVEGYHLGFAGELLENGFCFYRNDEMVADIDFRKFPFFVVSNLEKSCVFSYEKGKIFRIDRVNGKLEKSEMMYLHLQKRLMRGEIRFDAENYIIYPNEISCYDDKMLEDDLFWENVQHDKKDYFNCKKEKKENLKRDIVRFMYEPKKIDSLLYRFCKGRNK